MSTEGNKDKQVEGTTRRDFLRKAGTYSMASLSGAGMLMTVPKQAKATANVTWAEHFQKNYRLMTDDEKQEAIDRLEKRYSEEFGKAVKVDGSLAIDGVLFGYALNIQKCIVYRRCVKACVAENNQSRGENQQIEWIRVLRMEKGRFSTEDRDNNGYPASYGVQVGGNSYKPAGVFLEGQHYYEADKVPEQDGFYFPMQCMQCEKPPCFKVCPVRTTYRDPDGIVVVDDNWCIGCRMCIGACPYWARRFISTAGPPGGRDEPQDPLSGQPSTQ